MRPIMTHEKAIQRYNMKDACIALATVDPELCGTNTKSDCRGFTLVELLVVVVIIGVLSIVALSGFSKVKQTARVSKCEEELRGWEKSVFAFYSDNHRYPDNWNEITHGGATPLDPWGKQYVYTKIEGDPLAVPLEYGAGFPCNDDFDLYSEGMDGDHVTTYTYDDTTPSVSDDDIIRGRDGAFLGLRRHY
jgi:prepilin-type N-terminal cleavage/methylation domain-containing protein